MSTEIAFDSLYGTKYFSSGDLGGKTVRRKIGKVTVVELKDKDSGLTRKKYALYFEGVDKPLILNQTNALRLAQAYGKDITNWKGALIELYTETTSFGDGVRLRPVKSDDFDGD